MTTNDNFEVRLALFEGPFDLLLFFIERDELDIYDIPISKITNDFLQYLHQLENLNVELASEFILVAATLMRIKSKCSFHVLNWMNKETKSIHARTSFDISSNTRNTNPLSINST